MQKVRVGDLTRLTSDEINYVKLLDKYKTGTLHNHSKVYRLLDEARNPIANIPFAIINRLWNHGLLQLSDKLEAYPLKNGSFSLNYTSWHIQQSLKA